MASDRFSSQGGIGHGVSGTVPAQEYNTPEQNVHILSRMHAYMQEAGFFHALGRVEGGGTQVPR